MKQFAKFKGRPCRKIKVRIKKNLKRRTLRSERRFHDLESRKFFSFLVSLPEPGSSSLPWSPEESATRRRRTGIPTSLVLLSLPECHESTPRRNSSRRLACVCTRQGRYRRDLPALSVR